MSFDEKENENSIHIDFKNDKQIASMLVILITTINKAIMIMENREYHLMNIQTD